MIYGNTVAPDVLDSPDSISFWAVRTMLLFGALVGAWLTFDTRRSLKMMVEFGSRSLPFARRWSINPEKSGWIWFYRINGAILLTGILWIFARHYFAR